MADEVKDAFASVFRDYATDGVPSSGSHKPLKNEARALGTTIQTYVAANAASYTISPKLPVATASFVNVAIATGLENGDTVGGVVVTTGQRVLLGGQSTPAQNGIYVVVASGAASRATDLNAAAEFEGATVYVTGGTYAGNTYAITPVTTPMTVGTTDVAVVQVGQDDIPSIGQIIGPTSPATGSTASASNTWIFADPIAYDGYINIFRMYAMAAGEVRLRRFTKSSDTFTQVGGDISLSLSSGLNTFLSSTGALPLIDVVAGQYLGIYSRTAIIAFKVETGAGHWNDAGDLSSLTDSTLVTTQTLQVRWDIQQTPDEVYEKKLDALAKSISRGQQNIGLGKGITPDITGADAAAYTFVFRNPVVSNGYVSLVSGGFTGTGTMYVKRFSKSGDVFTQIAEYPVEVTASGAVNIAVGNLPYIPVDAGDYLGVFRGTSRFAYLGIADGINNYADPYYSPASTGNVTSFTDAASAQISLQLRLQVTMDPMARLEKGITEALEAVGSGGGGTSSSDTYYADTITAAEASVADLVVSVTGTLNREGVDIAIADSVTLSAATAGYVRYDVIRMQSTDLNLIPLVGTQRTTDATAFIPGYSDGRHMPMFLARVAETSISTVPLWRLRDGYDARIADQIDLDIQRTRRLMPKTMRKIRNGTAIKFGGFGDSITAIASDVPSLATPNGQYRDRATATGTTYTYLANNYQSDVLAAITKYTALSLGYADDGAGTVHTKIGWNWEIVAALVAQGYVLGTDVDYDNFGAPGKASSDAWSGSAVTAWTTAAIALDWDFVVIAFGMNERGSIYTSINLAQIAWAFMASGTEVILVDCPRPMSGTFADWQYTNRAIRSAALLANCGHVSFTAISDDRFLGSLGIDSADICRANGTNHPGKEELAAYGRHLARVFAI